MANSAAESSFPDECKDETAQTAAALRPSAGAVVDIHNSSIKAVKNHKAERETEHKRGEIIDLGPSSPPPSRPLTEAASHHHPQLGAHDANNNQRVISAATEVFGRYEATAGVDDRSGRVEDSGGGADTKEVTPERRAELGEEELLESGAPSSEEEEPFPTGNGGVCRDGIYAWNQSVHEVQVCVRVPDWARARDIRVEIRRSRLSVSVVQLSALRNIAACSAATTTAAAGTPPNSLSDEDGQEDAAKNIGPSPGGSATGSREQCKNKQQTDGTATSSGLSSDDGDASAAIVAVLEGPLSRPVQAGECLWTIETAGRVLLYLQKELPAEGEPGFEWWATVMKGDPEVDVTQCDAGSIASEYPEHARRRGAKALWEHQQKNPEQRRIDEMNEVCAISLSLSFSLGQRYLLLLPQVVCARCTEHFHSKIVCARLVY